MVLIQRFLGNKYVICSSVGKELCASGCRDNFCNSLVKAVSSPFKQEVDSKAAFHSRDCSHAGNCKKLEPGDLTDLAMLLLHFLQLPQPPSFQTPKAKHIGDLQLGR